MYREEMPKKKDVQVFKRTASRGKAINLGVLAMRGGIRF